MEPIEREFKRRGKWLGLPWFAVALGIVVQGLFTDRALSVGGVELSRNSFPALILLSLIAGIGFTVTAFGPERCRRCKTVLTTRQRRFVAADPGQLSRLVETDDAQTVGGLVQAAPDAKTSCILVVQSCREPCLSAGTVALYLEQDGKVQELVARRSLVRKSVERWLGAAERHDKPGGDASHFSH